MLIIRQLSIECDRCRLQFKMDENAVGIVRMRDQSGVTHGTSRSHMGPPYVHDKLNKQRYRLSGMSEDEELEKVARRVAKRSKLSRQTYRKGKEVADLPD